MVKCSSLFMTLAAAIGVLLAGIAFDSGGTYQAFAQTTQSRMSGLDLSSDKPINIESDQLQINEKKNQATFTGNVKVLQGDTILRAGKMIVYYASGGGAISSGQANIKEIELFNKVLIQSGTQSATADTGNFNMAREVLVLHGKQVVLTDADNIFTGCKLTIAMKTGQAKLDSCGTGRVKIQLDPKSRSAKP